MKYVLSIDPGMESGIVLGHYDDDTPYERDAVWQIDGGIDGFKFWHGQKSASVNWWNFQEVSNLIWHEDITIVCERFIPLASDRTFRVDELEPIRIEGALEAWGHEVIWQPATCQILVGGQDTAARKKATNELLKRGGLWLTGRDVGSTDANDAISATKHALHYTMFDLKHLPTIQRYGGINAS